MLDVRQIIRDSADVKQAMLDHCADEIQSAADLMVSAALDGKKILWCGNGGSAADAQHMAAELLGGAWANDTDYESIFSRQIEGLGESGDVLVAISTSGNSGNVIRAIDAAKERNISVIVLTGKSGGKMANTGDVTICIPSDDTQRIQEGHLLAEHILCESVEAAIMGD